MLEEEMTQPGIRYMIGKSGRLEEIDKEDDKDNLAVTNRLFVYGIFLGERMRDIYNMSNPEYATVPGYITVGTHIVQAVKVNAPGVALTGLTVDVDPEKWESLDRLEGGYDRIVVQTDSNESVFMYARPDFTSGRPERKRT